ncbi:peptide/nickel transport system permease protein [Cohaesibacter sp. ES.047]|uniref:ABC transporter permease n=1 Tax=Cohaesibacter sp. ES.047 TaxID=1798205 RepID=UPI000BBF65D8|nr:ABC transporter permease [Cohaesibacter sp. ES.047]SNY93151.1 peptide/nickel transport system permease protein [Cohaesibacter sp. ES.047]
MKALLRQTAGILSSLLVISIITFAVIINMPSDPVDIAIRAWNLAATDETVAALRQEWGLDQPFLIRYFNWLLGFVTGNWGRSFQSGQLVFAEFLERLAISFLLGFCGLALAGIMAIPLGFFAALKPGGVVDHFSRTLSVFVQTVPAFWSGLVLLWVLGAKLHWLRPFSQDVETLFLAICLIALHSTAVFARVYRKALRDCITAPYFATALSKGLTRRQALWHHCNKSALFALFSAVHSEAGWVIGSTATMEILFNFPGISQFLVKSIEARDQMILQAYVMVVALWMVLISVLVKVIQRWLDPRVS